jgi:2C-methyl-D-erythritol 2,4-cyclodiphosphate synthase
MSKQNERARGKLEMNKSRASFDSFKRKSFEEEIKETDKHQMPKEELILVIEDVQELDAQGLTKEEAQELKEKEYIVEKLEKEIEKEERKFKPHKRKKIKKIILDL